MIVPIGLIPLETPAVITCEVPLTIVPLTMVAFKIVPLLGLLGGL